MNTVIFKWNPSFSSYTMLAFLYEMQLCAQGEMQNFDWSVRDYETIHAGDRFFMLKVGYGQTGIVASGAITSEPYEGRDWSGQGRKTYYVDFVPDAMICPDAYKMLTSADLQAAIPDYDWYRGPSGVVLTPKQSAVVEELWDNFLSHNADRLLKARSHNAYISPEIRNDLLK